jgi:hypothetical protein
MIAKARRANVKAAEFLFDAKFGSLSKTSDGTVRILGNQTDEFVTFAIIDAMD